MLVKGLPPEALVRTPVGERGREPWTAYHELLAQLVEVTSVTAAEHRIKKPLKVPRPQHVKDRREARKAATGTDNPYRAAIAQLGGVQPSRKRQQLAAGGSDSGMTPPEPTGSYQGAMALLARSQPPSRTGGSTA